MVVTLDTSSRLNFVHAAIIGSSFYRAIKIRGGGAIFFAYMANLFENVGNTTSPIGVTWIMEESK